MDSKNIKDYLHLYIGCEIQYPNTYDELMIAKLTGVSRGDGVETTYIEKVEKGAAVGDYLAWKENGHHNSNAFNIKLVLRPLSDMTENEDQIEFPKNNRGEFIDMHWYPEGYMWLLSKGFDLFGLIDAGLAIKKSG